MAFLAGNGGLSGRGSRFRGGTGTLSEINVVPLVDVVLVLLIIFMLTAHVMEFGLEVDVPKVVEVRETAEELPVVTLTRNGEIFLADKAVNINQLGAEIRRQYPKQNAVYVRGDKNTVLDVVAQVASALGQAKLGIRLVTQPVDESDRPRR
jgi:biopolymer transport protein ExbD